MQRISELVKAEKHDDVIREAPAIRDLYPDYVEAGNLYEVLADALPGEGRQGGGRGRTGALRARRADRARTR